MVLGQERKRILDAFEEGFLFRIFLSTSRLLSLSLGARCDIEEDLYKKTTCVEIYQSRREKPLFLDPGPDAAAN